MILDLKEFPQFKQKYLKDKKIVCTSGFFDPIHPGHISCFEHAKKLGDILVVIVDGDQRCITKKGKPFIPEYVRAQIVDSIKYVDYVVIYNHPTENNCIEALDIIKPNIFAKGGDRTDRANVPEYDVVENNGGEIIFNVGDPKMWSSSNYLQEWVDFVNQNKSVA